MLRADDRIDDRGAVLESCRDPEIRRWRRRPPADLDAATAYVADRAAGWAREDRLSWAICEPTTGEMLGEVELTGLDLDHGVAAVECWALAGARGRGMMRAATGAVVRFAFGGLGLHRLTYRHAAGNLASARLAAALGFVPEGRLREAWPRDDGRDDVMVLGLLATDVDRDRGVS